MIGEHLALIKMAVHLDVSAEDEYEVERVTSNVEGVSRAKARKVAQASGTSTRPSSDHAQ